jgi:hypothetical protein
VALALGIKSDQQRLAGFDGRQDSLWPCRQRVSANFLKLTPLGKGWWLQKWKISPLAAKQY